MTGICTKCGKKYVIEEGLFSDFSHCRCVCGGMFRRKNQESQSIDQAETLEEARIRLRAGLRKGTICPCCGQVAKIYKRKLNAGMARTLVTFYRHSLKKPGWFHALREFEFEQLGPLYVCGDYSKLVYWDFIEERGDEKDDGNPSAGYFRITKRGMDFVEGRLKVNRFIYLYNDHLVTIEEEEGDEVSIREALTDKFNYEELMHA